MVTMNITSLRMLAGAGLLFTIAAAAADQRVATVLGEDVMREQVAAANPREQARRFAELAWQPLSRDYIRIKGLAATPDEIAELAAYETEFEKKDRAQRARKLADLTAQLGSDRLTGKERARAEEFRDALQRVSRYDAEKDALPKPDPATRAATAGFWIEIWKMNQALYRQYGGVVALTKFGHDPHGARAAFFADCEKQGRLQFHDMALREAFFALLAERPRFTVAQNELDFTPYWKRPIPGSYYKD